ncbi:hypothetical protein E3N88_18177 [Mikania micrantha]|uniref:Uncharacterized protein n=1 Tax=Mikania micrantha TaxID=192012 RepID=A0A5N6NU40_9ASTR|nr:hypothetical protein E3N88_18177 [Mikania micrantha]
MQNKKFTFDDIPPSKWRERSIEMLTWCSAEFQFYDIDMVIMRSLTKCQGRLRDWYLSLGEYRQLQIQQVQPPEEFMHIIYAEFIGSPIEHTVRAHDVNLKQVFLNSIPESLSNEAYRSLEMNNMSIAQASGNYINPSSGYFKLNYSKQWKEVRLALAAASNKYIDDISEDIMEDKQNWINTNPIAKSWDDAIVQYSKTHLLITKSDKRQDPLITVSMNFGPAWKYDPMEDKEPQHFCFGPYEDDPSHPDSRWK